MQEIQDSKRLIIDKMIGIYRGERILQYKDIIIYPVEQFLKKLHQGDIF